VLPLSRHDPLSPARSLTVAEPIQMKMIVRQHEQDALDGLDILHVEIPRVRQFKTAALARFGLYP